MAIVTRYFSTSGAGSADGSSWANRAALLSSGAWSPFITGFNFAGVDALEVRIGPGTYALTQSLAGTLFANAPSTANFLTLQGCDSSGAVLAPPDPAWASAQPAYDYSGFPLITVSTNLSAINLANCFVRMMSFRMSGTSASALITNAQGADWCAFEQNSSSTSSVTIGTTCLNLSNSIVKQLNAAGYSSALGPSNNTVRYENVRVEGLSTAVAGNRLGINPFASTSPHISIRHCTIINHPGGGVVLSSSATGPYLDMARCVVANNGGDAVRSGSAAHAMSITRCLLTGNTGNGINGQSAARVYNFTNRLRNNSAGDFSGVGNYPTSYENNTSGGSDTAEYADATGGDFRTKAGSALWQRGLGVADEPASSGGERAHVFGF